MNADVKQIELDRVTSKVIECAIRVSNALGSGFLEKVYENALAVELRYSGTSFLQQREFEVRYRTEIVGEYIPDLLVEDAVIVEIKALNAVSQVHRAQCMNCLRVTGKHVALLLNFGLPRLEIKRIVRDY